MSIESRLDGYFIRKLNQYTIDNVDAFIDTYEEIENENLKKIFSKIHYEINNLFSFMNIKMDINGHFNADKSRSLIGWIDEIEELKNTLKTSKYAFEIVEYYREIIEKCKTFLTGSGGSTIPDDFEKIIISNLEPIFLLVQTIKIPNNFLNVEKKPIGEGSYAKVYKYKDSFYNKYFVVKTAKKDLTDKEIKRFKIEYETMKKMSSPYVIEVYNFNDDKLEYIMEYADYTLEKFILKNNSKLLKQERKNIIYQVLKAFEYIHSKGIFHRDISLTNILIKQYDGLDVVKISDFGLVKIKNSTLTSVLTKVKGSLNDKSLEYLGFDKYNILHETYALTRVVYFILTGKTNIIFSEIEDTNLKIFVENGLSDDLNKRYKNVNEMKEKIKFL